MEPPRRGKTPWWLRWFCDTIASPTYDTSQPTLKVYSTMFYAGCTSETTVVLTTRHKIRFHSEFHQYVIVKFSKYNDVVKPIIRAKIPPI